MCQPKLPHPKLHIIRELQHVVLWEGARVSEPDAADVDAAVAFIALRMRSIVVLVW